jgi:thiamine-phosphate pyrophosphorylase
VTDRRAARGDLAAAVEAAVAGGVDLVQVRERELGGKALLEHVEALLAAARRGASARGAPVRVVVNRRVDVALAAGADGVHLGFDGMPPETARALLGREAWIGVSCHSAAEIRALDPAVVTYAHLAPIFAPLSKAAERPELGLGAISAARGAAIPILAQGGISAANAAQCLRAGAVGAAVTGAILQAEDPAAAARALRAALDRRSGTVLSC